MDFATLKRDAEDWGDALNDAGWAAIGELQNHKVNIPPHIWSTLKGAVRAGILKYIEAHETERPAKPIYEP